MPKTLERDLGLYATITISIGAMIGSGIFVLPGIAATKTGPSVILAYLLAGLIVLPAAISKAEMATAMPEAGGTYLYIDRAMGPLFGTIAGVGAWFSLVFKSAFALVGLGAYILVLINVPSGLLVAISLILGVALIIVNVLGVKQSGRLQAVIVSLVLLALAAFVLDGITYVENARFHPFLVKGERGILAATGFVFVSYAGVTKIASVAEEVEDPGRNIPFAMLFSVVAMMAIYTLTVFVIVGVAPAGELMTEEMLTPMAFAARQFAGPVGELLIAIVAVLALTSMANAGVLSSSRFPFAMSRDALAPERLGAVSDRFKTPVTSVLVTGVMLLALIALVPVVELAKLASAFKILIFTFVNVALIAFRESELSSYDPEFVSPAYPWVQLGGIAGGAVLLTQMGPVAWGGALGIIGLGVAWYVVYGREKTGREGAAIDALRRSRDERAVRSVADRMADDGGTVVVAMGEGTSAERERTLLRVAAAVAAHRDGRVDAVRFEAVPEQLTLSSATEMDEAAREFESQTETLATDLPAEIRAREVVAHDRRRAVANYVEDVSAALLIGEWSPDLLHAELLDSDVDWFMEHLTCDTVFVRDRGLDDVSEVSVLTQAGPYSALAVGLADAIATTADARLRFLTAVPPDARADRVAAVREYHDSLAATAIAPATGEVLKGVDEVETLLMATEDTDVAVVGAVARTRVHEFAFGDPGVEFSDRTGATVLHAHPQDLAGRSVVRWVFNRLL